MTDEEREILGLDEHIERALRAPNALESARQADPEHEEWYDTHAEIISVESTGFCEAMLPGFLAGE